MALNLTRALCGSNLSWQLNTFRSSLNGIRTISLKPTKAVLSAEESYDVKNMRLNRPQSPHLTIYKMQLTSVLSITHRITGVALAGYLYAFGMGALVMPHDISFYIDAIQGMNLGAATIFSAKFALAFPFTFHTVNGVRHLFWDLGRFLNLKEVYSSGYTMLASSVVLTAILASM